MSALVYVDHSVVRDEKLAQLKTAIAALADFVATNEPQLVSYAVFFDETNTRMTVVHVHRDAASLERHMTIAGPRFAPFAELVELESIEIYGDPLPSTLDRLHEKAKLLGGAQVTVHRLHRGFTR